MKTKNRRNRPPAEETRVGFAARAELSVRFTRDCLSAGNPDLGAALREPGATRPARTLALVDAGLAAVQPRVPDAAATYLAAQGARLSLAGAPVVVEGGEGAKTRPQVCDWLRARIRGAGLDERGSLLVIGGGALQDAAGFAAATLARPPRLIRVPTTLLSQASSAFSPRAALNAFGGKDAYSACCPAAAVVVDSKWLASLGDQDRRAGLAEVTRTALAADAELFHWLAERPRSLRAFEKKAVDTASRWCARLHWEARQDRDLLDPETPLPLGLWAADRLEAASAGELAYGEALAAGLALDLLLSVLLTGLSPQAARAGLELLARLGLPLWHDALGEADEDGAPSLFTALGPAPQLTLLRAPGRPAAPCAVTAQAVAAAIEALRRWDTREA